MDIENAWAILKSFYTRDQLGKLCVNQKLGNTERDGIEKYRFYASLLCEKAEEFSVTEKRKRELLEAAQAFEREAAEGFYDI